MVVRGADGVVADDVAAARIDQADALRARGMAALPVVGAAAGIFDEVALDDQMAGVVFGIDAAVGTAGDAPDARSAERVPSR